MDENVDCQISQFGAFLVQVILWREKMQLLGQESFLFGPGGRRDYLVKSGEAGQVVHSKKSVSEASFGCK